jgi:hypothetical protein
MESWYREKLPNKELILLSESGFTSDILSYRFLEHFIQHTSAGSDQPYKLLLMDNHGSHITPEFVLLATQNNIVPFSFPAHLTHCMQPLDVGIFQVYKHWHTRAIQSALETLDFDYTVSSFLRDLSEIRFKTFTKQIVKGAFAKSGMWPVNSQQVQDLMAKYMKAHTPSPEPDALPILQAETPQTTNELRTKWSSLQPKLKDQLSSPSQRQFESIECGLHKILDDADIIEAEKNLIYTRLNEIVRKKPASRRRVQKGGELTSEHAQQLIQKKDQERQNKYTKQLARAKAKEFSRIKKELHIAGVAARRIERLRKAELKRVQANDIGAAHLTISIPDPEKETENLVQKTQEARVLEEQEDTILEGFEAGDPTNWTQLTPSKSPPKDLWNLDYVALASLSDDSTDSDESVSVQI